MGFRGQSPPTPSMSSSSPLKSPYSVCFSKDNTSQSFSPPSSESSDMTNDYFTSQEGESDSTHQTAFSRTLSRNSSFTSIGEEELLDVTFGSQEFDKLSQCLSDSSNDRETGKEKTSVIYDVVQAQLTLWTAVGSLLYSFAWRQHRKKFIAMIFLVLPPVLTICCTISGLLTGLVVISRFCESAPLGYREFLNFAERHAERVKKVDMNHKRKNSPTNSPHRADSLSGDSEPASSINGEHHLPRAPLVCRRHSSNGSNGPVNVAAVLQSSHWSLNGSLQPPRRMAYAYSHRSASQEAINDVGLTPPAIST